MITPLRPAMARSASERPALPQECDASVMSRSRDEAMRKMGTAPTATSATTTSPEARTSRLPSKRARRA